MFKRIALAFAMLCSVVLVGCQNFDQITPERAIAHALTANKILAQCYADYQAELDTYGPTATLAGAAPIPAAVVVTEAAASEVVGNVDAAAQ